MQVAIQPADQKALRFLWNKDVEAKISKYKRLTFGATCSPPFAIYIFHRCAEGNNKLSNPEAYSAKRNIFFMVDYFLGFNTNQNAPTTAKKIKSTLQKGSFKLTKILITTQTSI